MKLQKKIFKAIVAVILAINISVLPIMAADSIATASVQPRLNNIASATLSLGFDENYVGYFGISLSPYAQCTGFDGMMRFLDSNGNLLKSWAISDFESPYDAEKTWQCEYGKTYTVTFQGYAYGNGTMYDEINLSVTDKCEG